MSGGFSPELRHQVIEDNNHRCQILGLQVDKLEGHHALLKSHGGSNHPKNCIMLAGYGAYCAYGVPVEDVHEIADKMGIQHRLYLNPETLEYVTKDELPIECFRDNNRENYGVMPQLREKKKKHKHK